SPGACSLRWSSPSLLSQTVKGWHARPGKETVTINLFVQEDRSPSGTGRAQFETHALTRKPNRNVPGTTNTTVDPKPLHPSSLAVMGASKQATRGSCGRGGREPAGDQPDAERQLEQSTGDGADDPGAR